MKTGKQIVLIGAGNLATQLGLALHKAGFDIIQVYSRTEVSAKTLAQHIGATFTTNLTEITPTADLYIYALKDDVLEEVINTVPITNGLHVHTSGSIKMSLFSKKQKNFGVFYPFQTFSKTKLVDFSEVPFLITANSDESIENLKVIANKLSHRIFVVNDEDRSFVHLSGVFACNFTNYLYTIAEQLLAERNLPFDILMPLITETVNKLKTLSPTEAQTGPAQRGDQLVITKQIQLLAQNPEWQKVYQLLTENIEPTKPIN